MNPTRVCLITLAWLLSLAALALHVSYWPPPATVNIRWSSVTSGADRIRIEQQLQLRAVELLDGRTWLYEVEDRSRENLGQLVSHPNIEDTHHIDRAALRLQLDEPGLPAWLRTLIETGRLPWASLLFGLAGVVFLWSYRRQAVSWARAFRLSSAAAALSTATGWNSARFRRWREGPSLAWVLLTAAAVFLSLGFTVGRNWDEEEFRFTILNSLVYARAVMAGQSPWWVFQAGLGQPLALTQTYLLHPLVPLLTIMRPDQWARVLYGFQIVVGTAGIVSVARHVRLSWPITAVCGASFLLAAPGQQYVLTDFWPTVFVGWTLSPWVLLATWKLLDAEETWHKVLCSVSLGLLGGVWAANGHLGYLLVYVPGFLALAMVHWRGIARSPWMWVLSIAIAGAVVAPTGWQIWDEYAQFPAGLPILQQLSALAPSDLLRSTADSSAFLDDHAGTRTLFFGIPFALLCVAYASGFLRGAVTRWDLIAVTTVSVAFLMLSMLPIPGVPARYLFRDPATLGGVLLAGLALQRLTNIRPGGMVTLGAVVIGILQLVSVGGSAWPLILGTFDNTRTDRDMSLLATAQVDTAQSVVRLVQGDPGRVLFLPEFDHAVMDNVDKTNTLRNGFGINALGYHGVAVVNGAFKGTSTDALYPSPSLFYGEARTDQGFEPTDALLDALAIRYVLGFGDEDVTAGLTLVERLPLRGGPDRGVALYRNPHAWAEATFVHARIVELTPEIRPDCGHRGLMCFDFEPVVAARTGEAAQVVRVDGRITVQFLPSAKDRLMLISEMYRPGWHADSGETSLTVQRLSVGVEHVDAVVLDGGFYEMSGQV